jgi:hypothetical protein
MCEKYPQLVAALALGACIIVAACIVSVSLYGLGNDLRVAGAAAGRSMQVVPHFPDAITVRNGNEDFGVRLETRNGSPIEVKQSK